MIRIWLFCLFTVFSGAGAAQEFGGNPPSLKWKQIDTAIARIIFPAGLDFQAQRVASIVNALNRHTVQTAGGRTRKINIVLQNQTTISNAYVGLAPFRSEFQLTADQNSFELGSLPWSSQLAIHEYRHVQQYNNYRIGLSKAFYVLFGEGGQEFANSLSVPNWFWEGDAVYQETLVSRQGRGRIPYFFNGYRALWQENKNYSWLKLRNGSLRDYIPDHYPLGYVLVAYGREKYGPDFWKQVTLDAASFKSLFYPLQKAISRHTGLSFAQFRNAAISYFQQQAPDAVQHGITDTLYREKGHFIANEEYPQFVDDHRVVYTKTTYKHPPVFMIRDLRTGREKRIKTKSISLDNYFSYAKNKIVYAAYASDPRWSWRDYSDLRILDIPSGKERLLTYHAKYFSPGLSDDGARVVAVNSATDGTCTLNVLSSSTGEVEKQIPNPLALVYTVPKFFNDSMLVSAVRNRSGEMTLALIAIRDGAVKMITTPSFNVLGFLSVRHDTVYFTAAHEGNDQLFAWAHGKLYKINLPKNAHAVGQYQVQAGVGEYAWTEFTAEGFVLQHAAYAAAGMKQIADDDLAGPPSVFGMRTLADGPADLLDKVPTVRYAEKRYANSYQLLHIHSWRPYISDPDYTLSLISENVLNTLESELYVAYNRNEHYTSIGADATYAQLFPWIDAGVNYTINRNTFSGSLQKIYWDEAQANVGLSVPLNFTGGKTYTYFHPGADLIYNKRAYKGIYKDSLSGKGFSYTDAYVNFSNQVQQAAMQIYPSFAQTVSLDYKQAVSAFHANQFLASGYFYLPGLARTHSLVLSAAFQQRDSLHQVSFANNFPFSRGYSGVNFYRMYRFGGTYHFPLAYPDWGFGNIVYILRVRAALFYDHTRVADFYTNGKNVPPLYRSYGAELYFDTKWWNQLNLNFGLRYSHLNDPDFEGRRPSQWEFILPINLLAR